MCKVLFKRFLVPVLFVLTVVSSAGAASSGADWWWFLYEKDISCADSFTAVRPFYLKNENPADRTSFTASMMPFLFWSYSNPENTSSSMLFGLWNWNSHGVTGSGAEKDLIMFPFVYYGRGESPGDNYFMLWPLGGTVRGKLGRDRISAWFFPGFLLFFLYPPASLFSWTSLAYTALSFVPIYYSYEHLDYKARGILWPLVRIGGSAKRDEFRILPFYSHAFKKDRYQRYSFLLLFNYEEVYFRQDTRYMFFAFPVLGRKWSDSGRLSSWTILWPFFAWGYDRDRGHSEYHLPWPFVQIGESDSPRMRKRIFFPFYGSYTYEGNETMFVTPLYFRLTKKTSSYKSDYHTAALIFWYRKKDFIKPDPEHGSWWRYFKMWPVFSLEYDESGAFSFNTLSLLPMRDKEGYERMYEPLWSVFEYRNNGKGDRSMGLLMRTYFQRWGDDYFENAVPFVFSYKSRHGRVARMSLLPFGMFSYEHNREGKTLSLFWFPISVGEAEPEMANLPPEEAEAVKTHYGPTICVSSYQQFRDVPDTFSFTGRL